MKKIMASLLLFTLMMCSRQALLADGAETEILLASGKKAGGELLVVREHSLLLSTWRGASDDQLQTSQGMLVEVSTASIRSVTLKREGGSHAAVGALVGVVVGGGVGYLVSKPSEKEDAITQTVESVFSPVATITCAVLGMGIGALIGSGAKGDKIIEASSADPDFTSLNEFARFQGGEPEFLQNKKARMIGE